MHRLRRRRAVSGDLRIDCAATGRAGSVIAVSGGPDSLALLLLAHAAFPDGFAATVDHGLRAEAAEEARFVATLCASNGHAACHAALCQPADGQRVIGLGARARYAALDALGGRTQA